MNPVAINHEEQAVQVLGMTCAACARRIEGALKKVPGVASASVNLVTEKATVRFDRSIATMAQLAAAIEKAGYGVATPIAAENEVSALEANETREHAALRRDVVVAVVLTVPLLVLGMSHGAIPGSDGPIGRVVQLLLATPLVFGPGRRFLKLAWVAATHRAADMNTLIALGALSAWGWSAAVVLLPQLFPHAGHGESPHIFFEAAGAIITFVLIGKMLEARARKRLSEAVRGLVSLSPKEATRLEAGRAVARRRGARAPRRAAAGGRRRHRGHVSGR
jgi:P-type Cu+ transporter